MMATRLLYFEEMFSAIFMLGLFSFFFFLFLKFNSYLKSLGMNDFEI